MQGIQQAVQQVADSSLRQQIFGRLDAVAAKLGVAVGHLWTVLVKQAYATAAENFVWSAVMLVTAIIAVKSVRWAWKAADSAGSDEDGYFAMVFLGSIAAIVALLISSSRLTSGLKEVINPEFWAWNQVMDWIRPAK